MNNKEGFTLVELLAVVAILAVIVIIALPNVMGMFNKSKENTFTTELKSIYRTAESQWISESMFDTQEKVYSRCKSGCNNSLNLSGREELEYYIKLDKSGKVVEFYATDGTYQFEHNGDLLLTNIQGVEKIADLDDEKDVLSINQNGKTNGNGTTCNYKIVAEGPGSFSSSGTVTELCFEPENDGYVFNATDAFISGNKSNDSYFQVMKIEGEPTKDTSIKIYSDSTKSTLLVEFNSDDVKDKNRYNLNNFGNYKHDKVRVKKIGDYTRTDYYVETSDDVCYGYDCDKPVRYFYGYSSFINETMITGPWITDPEVMNKIRYFEISLEGTNYELSGFTKCQPGFPGDSTYYDESSCTGNIYYVKYNDTSIK